MLQRSADVLLGFLHKVSIHGSSAVLHVGENNYWFLRKGQRTFWACAHLLLETEQIEGGPGDGNLVPRVSVPTTKRSREERPWERGCGDCTSGRVVRALYLDDATRDFGPEVAFSLSEERPSKRMKGRKLLVPYLMKSFEIFLYERVPYIFF